jgi:orotate phosphoribosyltransferase
MADLARAIARDLLDIGAVRFSPDEPFTWTSGLRSPIYCDNRLTIGHPGVRRRIAEGFAAFIEANSLRPEIIAGTATAGIPHAAWLAEMTGLPLVYVRSSAKGHGAGRQIEGPFEPGSRVVLVEDLVSTGGSSVAAVKALRSAGLEVSHVIAIFSYELPAATAAFQDAGIPATSLTTINALLEVAGETGTLDAESIESIRRWQRDPTVWSEDVERRKVAP